MSTFKKEDETVATTEITSDSVELEELPIESQSLNPPKLKKNVSFGLMAIDEPHIPAEDLPNHSSTSTMHRRLSVSVQPTIPPSFESGTFDSLAPLSEKTFNSAIPPPIPESLPTTPGYELMGSGISNLPTSSYFDQFSNKKPTSIELPNQQTMLMRSEPGDQMLQIMKLEGMTLSNPSRNKWRVISVVMWAFCAGLSDGAPGALLPSIEAYYNISYLVVSLIWLANACGYIIIALMSHKLEDFLGKRKMTAGGCLYQCIMFALISPGSKYPLVVLGFFFGGLGFATCLSQQNIFLSRFKYSSRYLGYYHGGYGTGACIGPVICTAMVNSGISWHYYYLILLGCTGVNFFNQWFAFEGADEDLKPWDTYDPNSVGPSGTAANSPDQSNMHTPILEADNELTIIGESVAYTESLRHVNTDARNGSSPAASRVSTEYTEPVIPKGILNLALKNSKTWLLSFFVLFYQGAEVALGGWIVTYLEAYRDANASSTGYVASGFWGGLALGRLVLTTLIHKYIGAKRGVWVMLMCSITTALLSWVVPNAIVESVLVSLCGLSIGPIYPLMITIAVRVLPRKIQVVSLTIMTAFGSSGGALFPFLVGLVSQFRGAFVVMPFAIALLSGTATIWYILPNPDRGVINRFYERIW